MTRSIYDLSWGSTSFLAKLELFFKSLQQERRRIRSTDVMVQAQGYSALSSTYYSIAGTAAAQLKAAFRSELFMMRVPLWLATWGPLATWCYVRMLPLSNQVETLIGLEGMTPEQCDVRQSVLRRRGRYDEAIWCIKAALEKRPEKAHTRGLLHCGLAEACWRRGMPFKAGEEIRAAHKEGVEAAMHDPRQAARIYRQCAELARVVLLDDPAFQQMLWAKAVALAESTEAEDQLLKL